MGRIRILPDQVANQIAAGEVVDRPASVVKELLENALDAGATEVRVDAENAGRHLISLDDNGCGMLRDDAMLAFERHATSKLSDTRQLTCISTLGFRGEALPSIASVSRLTLETRAAEESLGSVVEIAGGKLIRCDDTARPVGTRVRVRDLFYNVPARKKFLRSDATELAHIGSLVTHYSLAHWSKRFELFHGGRELLAVTPVPTAHERAFQVFGAEAASELIALHAEQRHSRPSERQSGDEQEYGDFRLEGFIAGPHVQKLNRNSIFIFVNGRLVRDKVLLHALAAAFHNLIPQGCFPFALLFLNCDSAEVDVNVHPAKTEVRFRHASFVHDFVRDAVRDTLMRRRPASSFPIAASPPPQAHSPHQPEQQAARLPYSEFSLAMNDVLPPDVAQTFESDAPAAANGGFDAALPEIIMVQPAAPAPVRDKEQSQIDSWFITGRKRVPDTHVSFDGIAGRGEYHDSLAALPELRPLGQLHDSFIIAAGRDGLWVIDQHVAHERVLFEQVLRQRASGKVETQSFLMPLVVELSAAQLIDYGRIAEELARSGFASEPFGQRTVAITAAPAGIGAGDVEKVLFEILEMADQGARAASMESLGSEIAAAIACRAAIKVNTRLENAKIEWLLRALAACDYPMTCPHGRPIALRYSTKDILKSFHRI